LEVEIRKLLHEISRIAEQALDRARKVKEEGTPAVRFLTQPNKGAQLPMHTHEIEQMCVVAKGPNHGPAPIPQEGRWTKVKEVTDISGLTHGVGWCAPQQGACKLTLNVKKGSSRKR
jgi:hypothetical protein